MEITISATAVAWYAALVGTFSLVVSGYVAFRDRARVRVKARSGCKVSGTGSPYDPSKLYVIVTVANIGRRTVTIQAVSLLRRDSEKVQLVLDESIREGREISEGKSTTFVTDQEGLDLENISGVVAYDQVGRSWRGSLD